MTDYQWDQPNIGRTEPISKGDRMAFVTNDQLAETRRVLKLARKHLYSYAAMLASINVFDVTAVKRAIKRIEKLLPKKQAKKKA